MSPLFLSGLRLMVLPAVTIFHVVDLNFIKWRLSLLRLLGFSGTVGFSVSEHVVFELLLAT